VFKTKKQKKMKIKKNDEDHKKNKKQQQKMCRPDLCKDDFPSSIMIAGWDKCNIE